MMRVLILFLMVLPFFLLLDVVWIGVLMTDFYSHELGELARREGGSLSPRWGAAVLVYILIPAGIVLFVRPLLRRDSPLLVAFGWGALFGLVVYGVYDLTNLAVIDRWTVRMTAVDMLWGAILSGSIAVVMRIADRWLSRSR